MNLYRDHPSEIYRFVVKPILPNDPRSVGLLADAHALGLGRVKGIVCHDQYFIEGHLSEGDLQHLAEQILADSLTQSVEWEIVSLDQPRSSANVGWDAQKDDPDAGFCCQHTEPLPLAIEVALRPGVTDPVAEQIVRAAHELRIVGVHAAATGQRYLVQGDNLVESDLNALARRLLANPVIQRYELGGIKLTGSLFPDEAASSGEVNTICLRGLDAGHLLALSQERRAALDLAEMQAIQVYCDVENRDLTDIEFEMIAQTWSEHCVHKTFKALIDVENPKAGVPARVDNLLRTYLRSATEAINTPWVLSAFVDNAGIIDFDEDNEVSFKVETHNHPSAIEPFGGANTGTGGVIRDVLGVSAKPIAATDVLCFGPQDLGFENLPEGVLHPRRIRSGVIAGVQDYGNKIGIPTVSGAILYDPGFTANPLVFCGCLGIAPKGSHPHQPLPGDRIILLGGRTGRDGLRGATFSSMPMDAQTGEVAGASVQIGDPITEKGLIEVIVRARDLGLYHAITDCGAGGLSSAVGEMTSTLGGEVSLDDVRLKYPGLAPWEIWLSEAQERMVLAVVPDALVSLQKICDLFEVELTDIGCFTQTGRLVIRYGGKIVLDLSQDFLNDGIPQRHLIARLPETTYECNKSSQQSSPKTKEIPGENLDWRSRLLLAMLAHPNIASKEYAIRIYDHEVQGGTVIKPLTGRMNDGPSDACVLKPFGTKGVRALVLANGINPEYGKQDAYRMAVSVIDEAVRNAVAVGANPDRIALLDNFCWGDPNQHPETMGSLLDAARGCRDAALYYQTPFISGKDSLNNEYMGIDGQRHAIPPTLLISSLGIIEDLNNSVTMDLKTEGNRVYLVGDWQPTFGGSHYHLVCAADQREYGEVRDVEACVLVPDLPGNGVETYRALHQAMTKGLVNACHDLSEGGLLVAAAEMCIGGRLGLDIKLDTDDPMGQLFGETNGCLLVEVAPPDQAAFCEIFQDLPIREMGWVNSSTQLVVKNRGVELISIPVSKLVTAWQGGK